MSDLDAAKRLRKRLYDIAYRKKNHLRDKEARAKYMRDYSPKYYKANKTRIYKRQLAWLRANPDRARHQFLKQHYGITLDDFNALLKEQNNRCAICGATNENEVKTLKKTLAIDHNHTTNKVRGLLCHFCNFGLGAFKDNPELLKNAMAYLRRF